MTKIPSVEEFDEIFSAIMGLETDPEGTSDMYLIRDEHDNVINGIDLMPERELLKDFMRKTLTADRTALLTELRESGLLEEKPNIPVLPARGSKPSEYHKAGKVCGHNDLARAIKAHLDELINPTSV